jgi:hypothetical protein
MHQLWLQLVTSKIKATALILHQLAWYSVDVFLKFMIELEEINDTRNARLQQK